MSSFFNKRLLKSRNTAMWLTCFLSMIWFVTDWCMGTTFRAMSIWELWINNLLASFILFIPFMLFRKIWIQILLLVLADCLMMANLMYSRTYFTGIPYESYLLVGNLKDFTASVWDSLRWRDLGFVFILVGGAILSSRLPIIKLQGRWRKYGITVAALIIISCTANYNRGGFFNAYHSLVESAYKSSCGVPVYTVAGHIAFSVMDDTRKNQYDSNLIKEWLEEHEQYSRNVGLPCGDSPRRNLVIILLESFESWVINRNIDGKEITPYINSLVADSTTFYAPYALTQTDAARSMDGQLLITSGLLPTKGTVFSNRFPNSTYPTLNKAMKEKYGTKSYLLTVDQTVTWNMGVVANSFGYDTVHERSAWVTDEKVGAPPKLSDGSFFRQSINKIEQDSIWKPGESRMLTFVTYSGHNPFILPDKLRDPDFDLRGKGYHPVIENYMTMAHYTDSRLHTVIDYLRNRPDWDETIVLITGDHEGLATQRDDILSSNAKGREVLSPGQFTPFIVLNAPCPMKYDGVFGQVDIYPTLLTMLGLQDYYWQGAGESLYSSDRIPAAISSMTGKITGDTTGIAPSHLNHWHKAREISDAIIRQDYFGK